MRIVDPHLHAIWMKGTDIFKMAVGGVEVAVMPVPHAVPWITSGRTLLRMWEDSLNYWVTSCSAKGVDLYCTLAVPFGGVNAEGIEECLKKLPECLKHERVVGIGEIGLNNSTKAEVALFKAQLNIAREHDLPVIVHTPPRYEPQLKPVLDQIIKILLDEKFPMDRVVLDHTAKNTLNMRLGTEAMVALSVCYDKNTPEEVASMVIDNPDKRDRILINSELGYDQDGYFSVPRAVLEMKRMGLKGDEIEKVTWHNPKNFFKLPVS